MSMVRFICLLTVLFIAVCSKSQLTVSSNNNATQLVQNLVGSGITVIGVPQIYCNVNGTATLTRVYIH